MACDDEETERQVGAPGEQQVTGLEYTTAVDSKQEADVGADDNQPSEGQNEADQQQPENRQQQPQQHIASTPPPVPPPPPPPIAPSTLQLSVTNKQLEDGDNLPSSQNSAESPRAKQILKVPGEQRSPNRKGSVVNFQEKCQLHMIDAYQPGAPQPDDNKKPTKPPALASVRYYIMLLALISPFVVTYSRTIINFAIIDMIHPDYRSGSNVRAVNKNQTTGQQQSLSTPIPNQNAYSTQSSATIDPNTILTPAPSDYQEYFDLDNSCPVSSQDRDRLINTSNQDKKRAHDRPGEKFEWDTVKQGLLKAAYAIGHSLFSIIGGRLAEIFGSHWIMGLSSFLIGVCCLTAPFLASAHFNLLFADLMFLGILGSFMTPALITLFANWLTPSEKSMMISFYLVSSRLGYALSSLLCGLLIEAQLSWRYLFYSAGWGELDYLASKNTLVREGLLKRRDPSKSTIVEMQAHSENCELSNGASRDQPQEGRVEKKKKKLSAPWFAILTNIPIWAFIITKFCVKLAGDTVQIELPTYLNRVMHFSPKDNGFINSSNYVIFCLSCLLAGTLSKMASKKHPFGWSKTTVRKVFQSIASFGVAITLFGISFSVCNNTMTLALLMLMFFLTTFGTGGEAQIPLDISERYAGTIHAIGSSLAISGAIEPVLVGFLLRGHAADRDSWAFVWMGASAIAAFGGVVFLIFGDANKQKFDEIGLERNDSDQSDMEKNVTHVSEVAEDIEQGATIVVDGPPSRESKVI